jgi:hypothetical protein
MMVKVHRTTRAMAAIAIGTVLAAGCLPPTFTGPPSGGSGSCLVGTFDLDTTQVLTSLNSTFGKIQVSPLPGGNATLTNTDTTWHFEGNQSLSVTGNTKFGSITGTADVSFDASGTYEAESAAEITLTLGAVAGSVHFAGTVFGQTVDFTLNLPSSGLDKLYGLTGTAQYTCSQGAVTTLTFTSFRLVF